MTANATFDNRITRMLGVEIPIVQAPMGWIARSQLASAVSNAGALGIIETSSGELDAVGGPVPGIGVASRGLLSTPLGGSNRVMLIASARSLNPRGSGLRSRCARGGRGRCRNPASGTSGRWRN